MKMPALAFLTALAASLLASAGGLICTDDKKDSRSTAGFIAEFSNSQSPRSVRLKLPKGDTGFTQVAGLCKNDPKRNDLIRCTVESDGFGYDVFLMKSESQFKVSVNFNMSMEIPLWVNCKNR